MNALIKRRENVRRNLTVRLGRGAMVANAAKLTAMMNKGTGTFYSRNYGS